jgi:hypothetical protein
LSWAKPEKDLKTSRHLSRSEIIVTECGSKHKITGGKRSFRLNYLQPAGLIGQTVSAVRISNLPEFQSFHG